MFRLTICAIALTLFGFIRPLNATPPVDYFNDFESGVGSEWSHSSRDVTPVGARTFLGQFQNDTVTLSLADLEAHTDVVLSFDFYAIRTWDGSYPGNPNLFDVSIAGEPTLLHATFLNFSGYTSGQSYPGAYPNETHPAFTGAAEIGTLGYYHPDPTKRDLGEFNSVYNLSFTFPHTADTLALNFSATGLQTQQPHGVLDESWGLDNVQVSPEPSTLVLLCMAAVGLLAYGWRRRRR